MLVSHEVPLDMLEISREFNDYDYSLVHLFKENKEYLDFYKESLRQGRTVYLDNSLFELEEMFDHDEFAKWVIELGSINPLNFYYIIPDALEEKDETINSAKEFIEKYPDLPGKRMGVVQGKNYDEITECFNFMVQNTDRVAISFDYSWYEELFPDEENKYKSWAKGRQWLMYKLHVDGLINNPKDGIHLLGCGVPQEFKAYSGRTYHSIKTVDTSNPVVHAIKSIPYTQDGLDSKISIKLVDLFDTKHQDIDSSLLEHNLEMFKEFCS